MSVTVVVSHHVVTVQYSVVMTNGIGTLLCKLLFICGSGWGQDWPCPAPSTLAPLPLPLLYFTLIM